jgi:hypothetical protein
MVYFKNKTKKIWVNFSGPQNGKCWYFLFLIGIYYGHLVYLIDIW